MALPRSSYPGSRNGHLHFVLRSLLFLVALGVLIGFVFERLWAGFLANPTLNGGHRPIAVLMTWGAGAKQGATTEASVLDLAPTVAALTGMPGASDWEGRVLTDLVEATPPEPVDTWLLPRVAVEPGTHGDPASERLMQQLEALGYVDDMGAPILGASRHGQQH